MKLFLVLLLSLLAVSCLADVSHVKHHKHHGHHRSKEHESEDEESHYLPPEEEHEPIYKKEKHTSERVVYHKEEDHEEPRHKEHHYVEHRHEEPKKQRVDHYHHYDKKPEVKTQHIHYKHSQPQVRTDYNRDLFTPAATQVVYRRRRPSRILYASAPNSVFHTHTQINVQSQDSELNSLSRPDLPAGAQAPTGAQLPTGVGFLPNCQVIAGNVPPGCGPSDPLGAQLPASALAPGAGNFPANQPAPVPGGQLAVQGNGQRPPFRPGGYGGYGDKRNNVFFNPSLGAQLGAVGNVAGGAQLGAGQGFDPSFGAQLPAAAGAPFNPNFGAGQAPAAQRPVAPVQAPVSAPAPVAPQQNQFNPNLQFGAPFDPALGAQLGAAQGVPNQQPNPVNPPLGAQLGAQANVDPNQGLFDPTVGAQLAAGQVPRLSNRRPPSRSNYQGLNVLRGDVFGQPLLQGPTNALGNQQDTNIIDGSFYSHPHHGHHGALVSVNPNQRSVLVPVDDDADDEVEPGFLGFAATNQRSTYVVAPKKHRSHRRSSERSSLDQGTSASEHDTDYREDGYHYQKPKHSFEF